MCQWEFNYFPSGYNLGQCYNFHTQMIQSFWMAKPQFLCIKMINIHYPATHYAGHRICSLLAIKMLRIMIWLWIHLKKYEIEHKTQALKIIIPNFIFLASIVEINVLICLIAYSYLFQWESVERMYYNRLVKYNPVIS